MSSGGTSNPNPYIKSALITGVTRRLLPDRRKQIGWALSELLDRVGYIQFLFGKTGEDNFLGSSIPAEYTQTGHIDHCYVDMGNTKSVKDGVKRIAERGYNRVIFNIHYDNKLSVEAQFKSIVLHHWLIARHVLSKVNPLANIENKFITLLPDELGLANPVDPSDFPSDMSGMNGLFVNSAGLTRDAARPSIRLALIAMAQHLSRFTRVSAFVMYPE
ncbi:hypothetical protein PFISCL1PPCAC_16192, partial [Pristionchus fissidentatus]